MNGINVRIMPRTWAEAWIPRLYDACISIGEPGNVPANLSSRFHAVLRVQFHDLAGFQRSDGSYPDGAVQLDEYAAEQIARFAIEHLGAETLVVHCEAGVSRSVAVGLAISTTLGKYWAWPSYLPAEYRRNGYVHNRVVFDMVVAALERQSQESATANATRSPAL